MSEHRPNIVLVTIDSLRADHCGFVGYEKDTTPTMDRMAESGTVFENAIAPGPATPESMPAIFTGQYPVDRETDADSELTARRERIRHHMEARDTLPEKLSRLGYETGAFTPNPFTSRHFGFDQGFDHFEDFMDEANRGALYQKVFQGFLEDSGLSSMARVFMNMWQREEVFKPWESYYDDAIEWIRDAEEPYFLWVFLMDAHNPYMSSDEYRSQSRLSEFHANFEFWRQSHETPFSDSMHEKLVTAYDDSIRYSDAFLERLRRDLAEDDPAIVIHGDHGEAFGEHGSYGHEPYLYPENVHVPLVVDGVEDTEISEPFSLRNLPGLLGSIAEDEPVAELASAFEVCRTRDGESVAVHTADGYELESVSAGRLENRSPFVDQSEVDLHERRTVNSAVGQIIEREQV
ncbi:sulfatase [Halorientalis pallida]|uniref:Arylsulfatase n=1 Tax=Halorientalis pallida TaxID=2479928 RepID=A0A498KSV9_9EURY|nr:sulfatase [Halorientalis pallida]RXK46949.1 arylsulfatase [Halorientalis pallida]